MTKLHKQTFLDGLTYVAGAVSTDKSNIELCQVNVEGSVMSATNGLKYFRAKLADIPSMSIPADSLNYLIKNLGKVPDDHIEFVQSKSLLIFEAESLTIRLKKLAVPYPDYAEEIYRKPLLVNTVVLDLQEHLLKEAVAQLDLPYINQDVLSFTLGINYLKLSSQDVIGNEAEVDLEVVNDKAYSASFYLTDFGQVVNTMPGEVLAVKFDVTDKEAPVLIESGDFSAVLPQVRKY